MRTSAKMKRYLGIMVVGLLATPAFADTLSNWTFEVSLPTGAGSNNGPYAAETGILAASSFARGFHANPATLWSNPVGNGSFESYSSNTWTVGDYYEFHTSTAGYENIVVSWEQTRSSTGPGIFNAAWSTDGSTFTNFASNYVVAVVTWFSGSHTAGSAFTFNLPAGADNATDLYIRLYSASAAGGTAGTNRVDDVRVEGTPIVTVQCDPDWRSGDGVPGVDDFVFATRIWDPDGAGAVTPVLVVGGDLDVAGDILANRIATFDPATGQWGQLGSGMNGRVRALATLSNGDLVAGGTFSAAGGVTANNIARWDGSMWHDVGSGTNGNVLALTTLPDGRLVVGGTFTIAGGVAADHIATYDPVLDEWASLGVGLNSEVWSLIVLPSGELLAGGNFNTAGGVAANFVARWDGTAWSSLGSGTNGAVRSLSILPGGDLIAGGEFTEAGGIATNRVAGWNGSAWYALGGGTNGAVWSLFTLATGELIAGGNFTQADGLPAIGIARWDNVSWSPLGSGITSGAVSALSEWADGTLYVGGFFTIAAGGLSAANIATWNGFAWASTAETAGPSGQVNALRFFQGDLVLSASNPTNSAGPLQVNHIMRWDGAVFHPMGAGLGPVGVAFGALNGLEEYAGELVVAGSFSSAGGAPANNIAKWNGAEWSSLGTGLNGIGRGMAVWQGDLVVGGEFTNAGGTSANRIARRPGYSSQAEATSRSPASSGSIPRLVRLSSVHSAMTSFINPMNRASANLSWTHTGIYLLRRLNG